MQRKFALAMTRLVLAVAAVLSFANAANAQVDVTLPTPTDDRWHYPFNMTGGTRASGTIFRAPTGSGFDLRDGEIAIRFRPSTNFGDPDYIPTGYPAEDYTFTSASLTIYHLPGTYGWDTRSATPVNPNGDPFAFEIFGMDVDEETTFTLASWTESSPYVGQSQGLFTPVNQRRQPFPLNLDDQAAEQNVANDPTAQSWGVGYPKNGYGTGTGQYEPNVPVATPFPIEIALDCTNPRVVAYIREGLRIGRIDWILCSTSEPAGMGFSPIVPNLAMKEYTAVPGTPDPAFTLYGFSLPPASNGNWMQYE